jgi:hypothetical protein
MLRQEYEAADEGAELFAELQQVRDEMNRFPDRLRWRMSAGLRPGHGVVLSSSMMIFTPLP